MQYLISITRFIVFLCLLLFFSSFKNDEKKAFVVEITFVDWLNQPFVKYTLDQNFITVQTSSYEDFKIIKSTIYQRRILPSTADSIYHYLNSIKNDTANANCDAIVLDGLHINCFYEGFGLGKILIKTHSCLTPAALRLLNLVEAQIKKKKYLYENMKYSK